MPELSDDQNEFDEEAKHLEEHLGYDHLDTYQLFNGQAHYGIGIINVDGKTEEIHTKRAYISSRNPMGAMLEAWESLYTQALAHGLHGIAEFTQDMIDEGEPADIVLENMLKMLKSEKFHTRFLAQLMSLQPDLIVIGNPNIVKGFQVETLNTEKMTEQVENFLKEVVKEEEE